MNEMFSQGGKGSTGILTNKQAIARATNVKVSEVIYSTNTIATLDGIKVIYAKQDQLVWGLPSGIPVGATIASVTGDKLYYNPGNVEVKLVDVLGLAKEVWADLAAFKLCLSSSSGAGYVSHKGALIGQIKRTLAQRAEDVINIKDFGAIGDGNIHPLSEIFSSLALAQAVYPFVTSLDVSQDYAGTQAAINASKVGKAVFAPSGSYQINKGLVADFALSMYGEGGQGLRDVITGSHSPSQVRGTVFHSRVATGRTLSVDASTAYCFGTTLRDFAIWGVEGQNDVGLYLNGIGWMGIIDGVNIQQFKNQALELGYIQDTYFTNCSFVASGNKSRPAITCSVETNYVYFAGCHFELTPYMIKVSKMWFLFFSHCHFEVARPVKDGVTNDDRFFYETACIDLGDSYRVFFNNNVFIPTDVAYLATKLGMSRKDVPYFMTSTGSTISFTGDTFMAPEGTIKSAYMTGADVHFDGVKFLRCDPSNYGLHVSSGKVTGCSYGIDAVVDTVNLHGIRVADGIASDNNIAFYEGDSSGKRTAGGLIVGGAYCTGNKMPIDARVNIYLDVGATVNGHDGGKPFFVDISSTNDVDLTKLHPAANLRITGGVTTTITHIYGAPYGRDVLVASNTTDGVIKYAANNVIPKGSVDYPIPQYHHVLLRCIDDGNPTLYQIS